MPPTIHFARDMDLVSQLRWDHAEPLQHERGGSRMLKDLPGLWLTKTTRRRQKQLISKVVLSILENGGSHCDVHRNLVARCVLEFDAEG